MIKNIAILQGGNSSEYVISEKSAKEIYIYLRKLGFSPYRIRVKKGKWTYLPENGEASTLNLNDFSLELEDGKKVFFDFAFIIIHGTPGEDGKIQSLLEMHNIPYNTSGVLSSALSFNKYACKVFLKNSNFLTPEAYLYRKGEVIDIDKIINKTGLPCFIKPNNGGSSFGVSKVIAREEIESAIFEALKEDTEVIIESYVKGIEISCGLLKTKSEKFIFPITEIVSKNDFFDFEAKYKKGMSDEITPARIPEEINIQAQSIASDIYDQLNCKGIVRIDFILKGSQLFFLELNSVPGMSKESIIPKQIRSLNLKVEDILLKIINEVEN
ncbi:MAG: D-alanine--D-alanine ligase [Bacteroidales bacterium]|nr:D-alanine--D-alanine ligase [Bacteroidales bacterium]MCF8389287.1 D-alanine--D-alanine ligase [Bacteroidales bacterium]